MEEHVHMYGVTTGIYSRWLRSWVVITGAASMGKRRPDVRLPGSSGLVRNAARRSRFCLSHSYTGLVSVDKRRCIIFGKAWNKLHIVVNMVTEKETATLDVFREQQLSKRSPERITYSASLTTNNYINIGTEQAIGHSLATAGIQHLCSECTVAQLTVDKRAAP
ncbi:hypothetical protein CBL_01256 [Carabus blaptoides fortunei]